MPARRSWALLPQELLAHIFEKLGTDDNNFRDLMSVSGVCKSWRESATWVSYVGLTDVDPSCLACEGGAENCKCLMLCLMDFLGRASCVKSLRLKLYWFQEPTWWEILWGTMQTRPWLKSLEELDLTAEVDFCDEDDEDDDEVDPFFGLYTQVLPKCRRISKLSLSNFVLPLPPLWSFVGHRLRTLELYDCDTHELKGVVELCVNLEELTLFFNYCDEELTLDIPPSVREMKLYLGQTHQLKLNAPGLQKLEMDDPQVGICTVTGTPNVLRLLN